MNLNKAIIVGRVTNDPDKRALPSGQSVVSFGIATNRVWYDQERQKKEETQFHNIVAFGKLADTVSQYVTKGSLILVEGRIQYRSWDDKDGQKRYKTEIVAEGLQLGPRAQGVSSSSQGSSSAKHSKKEPREAEVPTVSEDDEIDIEEEIPF